MGVGMPAGILLQQFGDHVWAAFGHPPYHVGSSLENKSGWRDVDVRLILSDEDFDQMFPGHNGDERQDLHNAKWVALCLAFSALGQQMTGLPIDFQIQRQTQANEQYAGKRSALGLVPHRWVQPETTNDASLCPGCQHEWKYHGVDQSDQRYKCVGSMPQVCDCKIPLPPPWLCPQWGQKGHQWLACDDCKRVTQQWRLLQRINHLPNTLTTTQNNQETESSSRRTKRPDCFKPWCGMDGNYCVDCA
jgi:hypothetical protein